MLLRTAMGSQGCYTHSLKSVRTTGTMKEEGKPAQTVNEEGKRAQKIFLEYWLLIGLLAGFNFYNYFTGHRILFLIVGIIALVAFIGWAAFYFFYVRPSSGSDADKNQ